MNILDVLALNPRPSNASQLIAVLIAGLFGLVRFGGVCNTLYWIFAILDTPYSHSWFTWRKRLNKCRSGSLGRSKRSVSWVYLIDAIDRLSDKLWYSSCSFARPWSDRSVYWRQHRVYDTNSSILVHLMINYMWGEWSVRTCILFK
jgi:hypothetical protein